MQSLKGKKLLILGGPALACDIVEKAREMGVYTIVTDWYEPDKSPAKLIADEYAMISTADVDAMADFINKREIDGVITGFTDSTLKYYQMICEKAGLPCYATKEQIEITTDKVKFKNLCKEFEIPVVEEYKIDDIDKMVFPVLVKPADNSGARGISICYDKKQLHNAYNIALNFSESKKVIIERYIEATEATIFYTINNGKIELIGVADRYTKNNQQGVIPLPVAYIFPSKHSKKYKETLDKKAEKMFKSLEMKNGMIFIQTFVENDKFIFYEMGYRLTGSLEYKVYERINGVNSLEQMINFALTGKMEQSVKRYDKSLIGCNITLLARPGVIGKIEGVEELKSANGIIDVFASYKAGDVIAEKAKGTLMQVVVRIFATAKTMDALKRLIELTHNTIKVTSANGENMLLDKLNVEEIYE